MISGKRNSFSLRSIERLSTLENMCMTSISSSLRAHLQQWSHRSWSFLELLPFSRLLLKLEVSSKNSWEFFRSIIKFVAILETFWVESTNFYWNKKVNPYYFDLVHIFCSRNYGNHLRHNYDIFRIIVIWLK